MSELASVVAQNLQKTAESSASAQPISNGESSEFAKIFDEKLQTGQQSSQAMLESFGMTPGQNAIQAIPAGDIALNADQMSSSVSPTGSSKISSFLTNVNRGQLQMEGIIEMATSGKKFSPPELLALQAGVYQIAQEMELTSKAFEQVNNAHKTVWNTNFQG